MRPITYYVAVSLDGFISGPDGEISDFVQEGPGVNKYLADLQKFDAVIMGRRTYEFGYKYGLEPGQPAYPHMNHHIFSWSLRFEKAHEKVQVHRPSLEIIRELKEEKGIGIYLCGGGDFANWLLEHELIDILKIKLNPLLLGKGVRMFGASTKNYRLILLDTESFEDGLQIMTFKIVY